MNKSSLIFLTFIIFFPPLAFGTADACFVLILQAAILVLFSLYLIKSAQEGYFEYTVTPLNILFGAFIIYPCLQLLFGISKYSYATSLSITSAAAFFMLFLSITKLIDTREGIDKILSSLTLSGFIVSVIGVMQALTKSDKIYWIVKAPQQTFFGTFVNENSFACYISMISLVTLGSIFSSIYSWERISADMPFKRIIVNTINNVFNNKTLFNIFAFSVMVYSIFLSRSRSGMAFFIVSLALFTVFLFRKHKVIVLLIMFGLTSAYFLLDRFGIDIALGRLVTVLGSDAYAGRTVAYEAGLHLFKDYPIFGIGFGTFSNIFPMYNYGMELFFFKHLHNDILQLLIEGGIVGFALIAVPFISFFTMAISRVNKTSDPYKYCIGLSILSSFFYLGLHSLTDFQLRFNAVSSLSVVLLAMLTSIVALGRAKSINKIKLGSSRNISYTFIAILVTFFLFIISRPVIASALASAHEEGIVKLAIRLEPGNAENYFKYARFVLFELNGGRMTKEAAVKKAEDAFGKAIRLNPYKTEYRIEIAQVYSMRYDYVKAFEALREATLLEPNNSRTHLAYAYMLFWKAINENDPEEKSKLLKKGLIYYNQAGALSKHTYLNSVIKDEMTYYLLTSSLKKNGISVK